MISFDIKVLFLTFLFPILSFSPYSSKSDRSFFMNEFCFFRLTSHKIIEIFSLLL